MAKAKSKEDSIPSDMHVKHDQPPDLQGASGIDQIQPEVIVEAPDATWYVRPASGGQYGPAPAAIVWQWLIEDRIGHDSLVWREDWPDWLSATQVFSDYFSGGSGISQTPPGPDPVAMNATTIEPISTESVTLEKVPVPPLQPSEFPPVSNAASSTTSGTSSSTIGSTASARVQRKRNRRMNYSVAIAVLAVILVTLAIGLVVVLYQQGVLGGGTE
jgi:hypothetical protein